MANNDSIDIEQKIKGNDNFQQQLIVQGDMYLGLNKEQVLDMIKCYCYTDKEQIIEIVQEAINHIPNEKRQAPNKRIFVPTIQQLSYSLDDEIIKTTYQQLLQSSMNKDKCKIIHPSFVEIIKQLSPIDAQVLNVFQTKSVFTTVCMRINYTASKTFADYLIDYCIDLKHLFQESKMEAASLQNLKRLGIINVRYDQKVKPDSMYDEYSKDDLIIKGYEFEKNNPDCKCELIYGLIELTDFGYQFCKICCHPN